MGQKRPMPQEVADEVSLILSRMHAEMYKHDIGLLLAQMASGRSPEEIARHLMELEGAIGEA